MHEKDKVFYKYYLYLEDKNVLHEGENTKAKITFYTSFVEQRKDIDQSSAFYFIKAPFELLDANVAFDCFLSRQSVQSIVYWLWTFLLLKRTSIQ